jgi:hypothetical protein
MSYFLKKPVRERSEWARIPLINDQLGQEIGYCL